MLRYAGDSKSIKNRVRQHCTGNVESSALRKTIAIQMGFEIVSKKRKSGSRKYSISQHNGEEFVSQYLQSGLWKTCVCQSADEARNFQWYVIDKTRPNLNKYMQFWDTNSEEKYEIYLEDLLAEDGIEFQNISALDKSPGVYSLWHNMSPLDFIRMKKR